MYINESPHYGWEALLWQNHLQISPKTEAKQAPVDYLIANIQQPKLMTGVFLD